MSRSKLFHNSMRCLFHLHDFNALDLSNATSARISVGTWVTLLACSAEHIGLYVMSKSGKAPFLHKTINRLPFCIDGRLSLREPIGHICNMQPIKQELPNFGPLFPRDLL